LSQKRGAYTNKTRREQQRRILGCREDEEEEEATVVVEGDLRGWEWEWEELVSQHNHKQNASAMKYLPSLAS
jgi:hypothetical protein